MISREVKYQVEKQINGELIELQCDIFLKKEKIVATLRQNNLQWY